MRVLEITKADGSKIHGLVMKDKRVVIDIHMGILQYLPNFDNPMKDFYYTSKTCHNKNIHVCKNEDILNKFKVMSMYIKKRDYFLQQIQKADKFVDLYNKEILSKFSEIYDIEKRQNEEEKRLRLERERNRLSEEQKEKIAKIMDSVTGLEQFYYSFCKSEVSYDYALAVAMKSPRQFYYRYGFAYRGAEKRPITKEEAIRRIRARGQIDVIARESYIEVNEFSSNDMW